MTMKSVGARMDFARNNNQYFATKLKDEELVCRRNAASRLAKPPRNLNTTPPTMSSRSSSPSPSTIRPSTPTTVEVPQYACICDRKSQVFECKICKMYIYGRVSEVCQAHPNVTYLLDLFYCPSCLRTKDSLEVLSN